MLHTKFKALAAENSNAAQKIKFVLSLNPLPHDKILDWSKFKALADDKINATQNLKFVLEKVKNILEKGENVVYQHFLFFQKVFIHFLCQGHYKS